jgi:hypothetical protein
LPHGSKQLLLHASIQPIEKLRCQEAKNELMKNHFSSLDSFLQNEFSWNESGRKKVSWDLANIWFGNKSKKNKFLCFSPVTVLPFHIMVKTFTGTQKRI